MMTKTKKITLAKAAFILTLPVALVGSHFYFSGISGGDVKISEETKARWTEEVTPDTSPAIKAKALKELKKQLSAKGRVYQTQIQNEASRFEQKLRSVLDAGKAAAHSGVAPTINHFTEFGNAASLVKDLALDEAAAEATISAVIEKHISGHLIKTQKQIEELLNVYTLRTQAIANRYTAEVQGVLRQYKNSGIDGKILQKIEESHVHGIKNVKEAASSAGNALAGAAVNVAFDAASFKATKKAVKAVLKCALKTAVKRAGATVAVSGTTAVADGPFPVGDIIGGIIAIGGAAWTAYDICDAYDQIRHELPKSLKDGIDETLRVAEESALKRFEAWNTQLPKEITL